MSSIWDHKPWWCQPWTILLTGMGIIGGSWLIFHRFWITVPIAILIIIWWVYFLIIVPPLFKKLIEEGKLDPAEIDQTRVATK